MIKRSLLATAIAALTSQTALAAPFMPMDARGLAMGNTGVASAKRAHAPAYNPSLLSQADEDDDFALLFPQLGVNLADEEEMVDTAQDINDEIIPQLEDLFDDSLSGNFNDSVEALSAASATLTSQLDSLDDSDGRTPAQKAADLQTDNNAFRASLADVESQINDVDSVTHQLDSALNSISGSPLSGRLGVAAGLAIPSKKFAAAISLNGNATFSGRMLYSGNDSNLLTAYSNAAGGYVDTAGGIPDSIDDIIATLEDGNSPDSADVDAVTNSVNDVNTYTSDTITTADGDITIFDNGNISSAAEDPQMDSQLEVMAIAVVDLGLSFSREFTFGQEKVAIGITPKLQKISTYHYVTELDSDEDIETEDIEDSKEDFSNVNLDIGASWRFGNNNNWMLGLVGKNLLGGSFETADAVVKGSPMADYDNDASTADTQLFVEGHKIELNPQFRAGISYNSTWVNAAIDVDLTENDPIAFENPTQFVSFGAEFDVFRTLQLRAGYRTNLSVSGSDIASIGFGLSPFGLHIDIAAMANVDNPESEAGIALETGFYF